MEAPLAILEKSVATPLNRLLNIFELHFNCVLRNEIKDIRLEGPETRDPYNMGINLAERSAPSSQTKKLRVTQRAMPLMKVVGVGAAVRFRRCHKPKRTDE